MPVTVACTSCGAKLRAPDNAVGRSLKCPKCGKPVTVDAITAQPPVASVLTPPVASVYTPPVPDVEVAEVVPAEPTRACPFCGETVLAVAKKCKHCGETIDVALRAAEEARRTADDARRAAERAGRRQDAPLVFMNAGGAASSSSSR
ncbi:MAG TPA: hypothetical protein VMF69_24120 [Gemmataceae bacterium]|nr:hypothetical protein [Gemmataceae bacterium]